MQLIRADIAATGSISKTAARIGISRPALSQILNGIGPYGTGRASTKRIAERVLTTIGMIVCPFLSEYHGSEQRITGLQCREYAYREHPPTNSPREMQHWRFCQICPNRVPAAAVIAPVVTKPTRKIGRVSPQRSEVYAPAAVPVNNEIPQHIAVKTEEGETA